MPVDNSKFSTFASGGDLVADDIVVGLRAGVNTRFNYAGALPPSTIVPITQGGTGATTASAARTNLGLAIGVDVQAWSAILDDFAALVGTTGLIPRYDGTNWVASTAAFADTYAASTLLYSNGANNVAGLATANSASLVTTSAGVPVWTGTMINGQVVIGSTGATPVIGTLTAGTNVSITNGAGSITINATGSGTVNAGLINELAYYAAGGTTLSGLATANSAVLVTGATGTPVMSSSLTNGQVILGSTGATPVAASITAGAGISITPGAGTLTIASSGSGLGWNSIAGTTQAAAVDTGYICANAAQTTVTLPATAAIGATVLVEGLGAGGWVLAANIGQTIQIGSGVTSSGGSLTSAAATDNVSVVCIVANTTWRVQRTNSAGLTIA